MNESKNVQALQTDLQDEKRDLREDLEQISEKARETRAELNPTSLVRERIFLLSGRALVFGFAIGYLGSRLKMLGIPVARIVLGSLGKQPESAVDAI